MPEDARDAVAARKTNDKGNQLEEIKFENPVKFLSTVSFSELPESPVLNAPLSATTISVLNVERVNLANTGLVSVTDFLYGAEGQNVLVKGDGFTTIVNGTPIATSTGADKLLAVDTIYSFTRVNAKWYEQTSGSSYTAGAGLGLTGSAFSNLYVGKHISILGATVTHTAILGAGYDPFGPGTGLLVRVVADCTGMGQFRIMARQSASSGNTSYRLGYATTSGGAATNISAVTLTLNGAAFAASAFATLPAGAKIASAFLTIEILQATAGNTSTLEHFSVELKP